MNTRTIILATAAIALLWSCDEPPAYENDTLIYNPFTVVQDTIPGSQDISFGRADIDWGKHLRAVVGDTRYYKAGFTMDFDFSAISADTVVADSVRLEIRHAGTYPEDPHADTLDITSLRFAVYKLDGEPVDLVTPSYGTLLGTQEMTVQGEDNHWSYLLPPGTIAEGDSTVTLGFFPQQSDCMSLVYGGGSTLGPALAFYYHTSDTAGLDSATAPSTFMSDSVYVHLLQKPEMFAAPGTVYLSQLWQDSLVIKYDLNDIHVNGDTLLSIVSAYLLPGVDTAASAIYLLGSADSLFQMKVTDASSNVAISFQYGADGRFYANDIRYLLQSALDAENGQLELVLRPNHTGYDPGFLAITTTAESTSLASTRTLAVRP